MPRLLVRVYVECPTRAIMEREREVRKATWSSMAFADGAGGLATPHAHATLAV
jgi:hypothetical protein